MLFPRPAAGRVHCGRLGLVLAAALFVAACGGGPAPRVWAASVCAALRPWQTEIGSLASRTQQQMTAKTTPAQAKENLVRLFKGAEAASEAARRRVEQAGVPEADNGDRVARAVLESLSGVRDAYGRARTGIEALRTTPADAFHQEVRSVVGRLQQEYDRTALDTTALRSVELQRAFNEVPECH